MSQVRVSIKWKIFAFVAILISSAIIGVVLRTSQIFHEDKEAFVKELSAKLASSTAKTVSNRISNLQDKLGVFISSRESLAHTGAKLEDQTRVLFTRYQEFSSIGYLTAENGTFKPKWILRNPRGSSVQWPADFEKSALASVDFKAAVNNGRLFAKGLAPDGHSLSIMAFSVQVSTEKKGVETIWIVGILPPSTFDDLLNDFSTGLNTGFIVDNNGTAISHSDPTMRLKNLSSQPLVIDALKNNRPAGTGDYLDSEGRAVIGSFDSIPKTNLFILVSTPRDKAFEAANVLMQNILFIGFTILAVALAAAVLLSNYIVGPLQKLATIAAKIGAGDFKVRIDVTTNDEIGDLATSFKAMEKGLQDRDEALASTQASLVQSEKMGAFGQLSAGIAHEVKNPLAGILGHVQLAMGKSPSDDMKKHLDVIEKETRRCKAIVENLMRFARSEKAQLQPTNLEEVVQDTINLVDHQLSLSGCKILKDIKPCPMVEANGNQLQQVLLNLMVNASHAMEKSETKNVTVRLLQAGNKAQLQIQDTGSGITPEVQKKIFEPFFTTKPAGKGTGLGLSVSIGIVNDHKGEIYLKSEVGKGTTFFIDIPIPEKAVIPTKSSEPSQVSQSIQTSSPGPETSTKTDVIPAKTETPLPQMPQNEVPFYSELSFKTTPSTGPRFPRQNSEPVKSSIRDAPKELPKLQTTEVKKPKESVVIQTGTPAPVPKKSEDINSDIFFGTSTITESLKSLKKKSDQSLGGKKPLKDIEGLPPDPRADSSKPMNPVKQAEADYDKARGFVTEIVNSTPQQAQRSEQQAAAAEIAGTDSEFKVKIKRPKLKA